MAIDRHEHDEADVRELVEAWAAAVRRKDTDGILRNHTADFVMFDVPPPPQSKGLGAYKSTWDLFFSWSDNPVVFDIQEMSVTAGADVTFAAALMKCRGPDFKRENRAARFPSDCKSAMGNG